MKTSRWVLSAAFAGGLVTLAGCGAGQYQIPNVAPVVKPKPGDDLLEDIENGDSKPSTDTTPSAPPADKTDKPADKPSSDATPPSSPEPTDDSSAKPATAKATGKGASKKK